MNTAAIEAHDLSKCYVTPSRGNDFTVRGWFASWARREVWALRRVTFEVARGETVAILGRNGAGKSTLLRILSRITEPSSGRAILRGSVASLLGIGAGFHPELSGRENVYIYGALLGMGRREIRRRFDEIVEFAELPDALDMAVKHYSTGMSLRLAFSIASHLSSDILLIDEILAVGDLGFQRKCLEKTQELSRNGRTMLIITHDLVSAERFAHRAYILDGGAIVSCGETASVVSQYRDRMVA